MEEGINLFSLASEGRARSNRSNRNKRRTTLEIRRDFLTVRMGYSGAVVRVQIFLSPWMQTFCTKFLSGYKHMLSSMRDKAESGEPLQSKLILWLFLYHIIICFIPCYLHVTHSCEVSKIGWSWADSQLN